ncbi:hypothetical protein DBY21_10795 [Candidatus Gastranaerophilales bacterium]|nr:MAG: hypothetical protein DBY21_10795 [Candidatus Gastranaerophilales bacterium]
MKKKLGILFKNLCCSICKHEFDEDSITIKREENGLLVTNLQCRHCGKNYGVAFLGFSDFEVKEENKLPLDIVEGPDPISFDDVIDAHRFIKNLDENWKNFIKKEV